MNHKLVERLVAVSYAVVSNQGTIYFIKVIIIKFETLNLKL